MNIDLEVQRRTGGIKPMDEQFPGYQPGGYSKRDLLESDKIPPIEETTTVAVMNGSQILMGQRRDNGKWTMPGGGLNQGEDMHAGACRELFEEAGIRSKDLKHIGSRVVQGRTGSMVKVHAFKLESSEHSNSFNDPDQEVQQWKWIETPLPLEVLQNLQSPKNYLLELLGLQTNRDELTKELKRLR